MKAFFTAALIGLTLTACAPSESDALRGENATLKQQLEAVTKERDDLRARVDAARAALEGRAVTTPDASAPDPNRPLETDPNASPLAPSAPPVDPNTTPAPTPPAPPPPAPTPPAAEPSPPPATPGTSEVMTRLRTYADNVLSAAQNYNAQTKNVPSADCRNGYAAGDYKVDAFPQDLQACEVTPSGDGAFAVSVRDANGNAVRVP
jgi:hypothetical protein